jgi:hypothetical protein
MQNCSRLLLLTVLAALSAGCFYTHATVNILGLERQGLSLADPDPSDLASRKLGMARANDRSFLFADCDAMASRALAQLIENTTRMGGNRLAGVQFLGRWSWISEPVCRRNYWYSLLIVPLFLPVPMSVTVSGVAIHDPDSPPGDSR